ncbi:MAG TPA: PKD domain-containing protein, partial [Flavisolibacter sp.]|nr:PKD domain-containing protein [Flavisolibacter sp.]
VTCDGSSASADNYIVQAFPKNAWGKRYLTAPTRNFALNYFRVCVTDPSTVVKFNGSVLSGLQNNFFYQFTTSSPGLIEADKPILVSQYITSQNACGNGTPGDPEVIYLSPVEQNIDKVILNSTANFAISRHFINVIIKSAAVGSFRLDGNAVAGFQPHPQDGGYSYAQLAVTAGKHSLSADSGFNAIAYGYGAAESYGYNAGTNVKDLYQFVSVQNQFATVNVPMACKASPFYFYMTFPYQPTQIKWVFGQTLNAFGIQDVTQNSPVFDSTWVVNDKQLYRYKLPTAYTIPSIGTYPIRIIAENPTPEGCSGEQEIDYDLEVYDRPVASFNFTGSGCLSDSVQFTDNSSLSGRSAYRWFWNFGDNNMSTLANPAHLYKTSGSFPVKFALISDIGCLSDTAVKMVTLSEPPVAKFDVSSPQCVGKALVFTDASTISSSSIVKWTWDFGDGTQKVEASTNAVQTHNYNTAGTYTATLQVESASGCKSIVFTKQIIVSTSPKADFTFGTACLPSGTMQFTNQSTITDGTQGSFMYAWNFGEGGIAATKDPLYNYKAVGPYTAQLVVTSGAGCKDTVSKMVNTIYEPPVAAFSAPAEICFGTTTNFTDQSKAPNSTVATWEWNFGDGSPAGTSQNPSYLYAKDGTYQVSLNVISAVGCRSAVISKPVVVNPLPFAS